MIGPGGLVLVVSHVFAVPVSFLWVGLKKTKQLKLDVKMQGYILSTAGDALLDLSLKAYSIQAFFSLIFFNFLPSSFCKIENEITEWCYDKVN
jgi:hypothetical protein